MKTVLFLFAVLSPVYYAHGGYTQAWLRGDENTDADGGAMPHEGLRLIDGSGWVAIGETNILTVGDKTTRVLVRKIDNEGKTVWSTKIGDSHKNGKQKAYSNGFSIHEDSGFLYIGIGLWQKSKSYEKPAVAALDVNTGNVEWTKVLDSQPKHGGVRGLILDGDKIICTGYVDSSQPGYQFVADDSKAVVWELTKTGTLVKENVLNIDGLGQGAKIRKDLTSGYIMTSTAWGEENQAVALVKLSNNLNVEWSQMYGMAGGDSQAFDMLVDKDGNYLMGGHTTVGMGVVNWDYLALKVNSQTKEVMFRKTFGQPRNFKAKWIHDEMYGVKLDKDGNYLLLGGSGDEYPYSSTNSATGWSSDVWVSYLVVLDKDGNKLYENVYGDKGSNNAGEYLAVDPNNGDIMVFSDSDALGGAFGFLKLTNDNSPNPTTPPGPPPPTTQPPEECTDKKSEKKCKNSKKKNKCRKTNVARNCKKTCEFCGCVDIWTSKKCKKNKKKCNKSNKVAEFCKKTCNKC